MGPVPGAKFADQIAEVAFDRFGGQLQAEGNFMVAGAARRPAEDLPFPSCQGGGRGSQLGAPGLGLQHGLLQHAPNSRSPEGPQGGGLGRAGHHQHGGQVRLPFSALLHQLEAAALVQVVPHQQQIGPEPMHQLQARRQGGCRPQQQLRPGPGSSQETNEQGAGQTANPAALSQDWSQLRGQLRGNQKRGRLLHADQGGAKHWWGRSRLTASFDTWIRTSRRLGDFPESNPDRLSASLRANGFFRFRHRAGGSTASFHGLSATDAVGQ